MIGVFLPASTFLAASTITGLVKLLVHNLPEWQMAAFEDARLWSNNEKIASIRFRRALEPTSETSCLTDRELLEDIQAMLKQLIQQ